MEHVYVRLSEQGISRMSLVFADHERDWEKVSRFGGGAKVEAELDLEDHVDTVFSGELTGVRSRVRIGGGLVLTLEAEDKLHRLKRSQRQRILLDLTDGDLVQKLASECGMTADVEDNGIVYSSIIQYGVTNYDLLQERAGRIGYVYWAEGDTLHFKPRRPEAGRFKLTWGQDVIDMRVVRTAARVIPEVRVRSWNMKDKQEELGEAKAGDETLVANDGKAATEVVKTSFSDQPTRIGHVPLRSQSEGEAIAKGRLERSSLGFQVAKGICRGVPTMKPGSVVEFENVPSECKGTYRVVNVVHRFGKEGMVTHFEARRNYVPE